MNGDVIEVEGLEWYEQFSERRYNLCHAPKGVFASVSNFTDGGWCIAAYVAASDQGMESCGLDGWYVTRDDAMKAVAAWIVTLRLQGKIKEEEDGN